jgi:DNA polymerase I-like protein with 3'-5' exonuclease and polymerase domains
MTGVLVLDTESNTWNNGNPFDRRFRNIAYSYANEQSSGAEITTPESIDRLKQRISEAGTLVGFNAKYDVHVFRKIGITEHLEKEWWDCQVAEFILSGMKWKYPSLNESCEKYGLGTKIDIISQEYWNKGIQTEDIPWNILHEYATNDAVLTMNLYIQQMKIMTPSQRRLCRLQCMDLLILEEMEWNGIKFDEDLCKTRASELEKEIQEITDKLASVYPDVPINFNSGDDLSAFLYGGVVKEETKEHIGFFKTGAKIGQPKYKNVIVEHTLPRLVEPLRGSELKKEGFYATNADTLLKLRPNRNTKGIIELIQRQVRLDSLLTKTYRGIVNANSNGNWEPGWLHGQFNQCVAATGRLSSSNPNLQNLDSQAQDIFISRYN